MVLLPIGIAALVILLIHSPGEKLAILQSALALVAILVGIYYCGGDSIKPKLNGIWQIGALMALFIGILTVFLPGFTFPDLSVIPLAVSVSLLFVLSKFEADSDRYVPLLACFLAGMIAYNAFFYYPLDIGQDSWGYLAAASRISQTGQIATANLGLDPYYQRFPTISIISAVFGSLTGLNLVTSLFVFPGIIITLQPLFVFLLSRSIFGKNAANLSALIVVSEAAVTRWINQPIAEAVAMSMALLFFLVLTKRPAISTIVTASVLFVGVVASHGAVALLSVVFAWLLLFRRQRIGGGILKIIIMICVAYLTISTGLDRIVSAFAEFTNIPQITATVSSAPEVYRGLSTGLPLLWYGWPVALALALYLVQRRPRTEWIYAGLGLLGFSFALNVIAPSLVIDRYGGLFAWFILAIVGGQALHVLTKSSRQTLIALPILLLICTSGIVDPTLSPQYTIAYGDVMPTSVSDRVALNWINLNTRGSVFLDQYAGSYLRFLRYESTFSAQGIIEYQGRNVHDMLYIRSQEIYMGPHGACSEVTSMMINFQWSADMLYNDGCGIVIVPSSNL
jgi:hypothetical protein